MTNLKVGDRVKKAKGYSFPGVIVAKFETLAGNERFVVEMVPSQGEDGAGMLHIFDESVLKLVKEGESTFYDELDTSMRIIGRTFAKTDTKEFLTLTIRTGNHTYLVDIDLATGKVGGYGVPREGINFARFKSKNLFL